MPGPVRILQWSVALTLGSAAAALLWRLAHGHGRGLPHLALPLAAVELVAALAFLVPRARRVAGWTLLFVLAAAALVHSLHGEAPPASFLVFGAAIWVVLQAARVGAT